MRPTKRAGGRYEKVPESPLRPFKGSGQPVKRPHGVFVSCEGGGTGDSELPESRS